MKDDPATAAVKTYDYVRIALAALVLLLFTSIAIEWMRAGCGLQPSISSYYYTPVHSVFIGVLVTMGICLIALQGNTDGEDVLLNLAGMLAPVWRSSPRRSSVPAPRPPCWSPTSRRSSTTPCPRCS